MLDLQFTVHLSAHLSCDGVSLVIDDLLTVKEPFHLRFGHTVATHPQRDIIVIFNDLFLEWTHECRLIGCKITKKGDRYYQEKLKLVELLNEYL